MGSFTDGVLRYNNVGDAIQNEIAQIKASAWAGDEVRTWNKLSENKRTKDKITGRFIEEGDVSLQYNDRIYFIPGSNRIGRWGLNKGGENDLKKIAFQIYKNSNFWKFIADVNGISGNKVNKDVALYLPDFAVNSVTIPGGDIITTYCKVFININKEKKAKQTSGNITDIKIDNATYRELAFQGLSCADPLVKVNSLTYHNYLEKIGPKPTKGDLEKFFGKLLNTVSDHNNEIDTAKSGGKEILDRAKGNYNRLIKNSNGYGKWQNTENKGYGQGANGYNGEPFAREIIKSDIKGQLVFCAIWAGVKAANDLEEGNSVNDATYIFGKELVKGVIGAGIGYSATYTMMASTLAAESTLLLIPGIGWGAWVVIALGTLYIGYKASKYLDETDENLQNEGFLPKNGSLK
jgi:hypothetical protein